MDPIVIIYPVIGLGLLFFLAGILFTVLRAKFLSTALLIQGSVIDFVSESSVIITGRDLERYDYAGNNGHAVGQSCAPVIEYPDSSGNKQRIKGIGSSKPKYHIGEMVNVRYRHDKPNKAIIDSFWEKWLLSVCLLCIGLGFLITGLLTLILLQ